MAKKTLSKEELEIKRLRSSHDLWKEYQPRWCFYQDAYTGGDQFTNSNNLFKHFRETQEDYNDRVKRLHNVNYCAPIVDFYTNFIFSEVIDRSGGSNADLYNKFRLNVNRRGANVDEFMRSVSDDTQIYGMSYVVVDSPTINPQIITSKADELANNIGPYWTLVKPTEILDWVVDEFGAFQYVKRQQHLRRLEGNSVAIIEKYTEFFNDSFIITEIDVTDRDKPILRPTQVFLNPIGIIPIEVSRYKRNKIYPELGDSFLIDFAGNNREILNLTSLEQEFLYRQAFNILAKEGDDNFGLDSPNPDTIGTTNLMEYPKGAKAPSYITPPSDPAKYIQDKINRLKNDMFLRASQDAMNQLFNGEGASGFSQSQSFSKTVPFISSRADELEQMENRLMTLTMKWVSKEWDGKIKYKDRYDITNFTDALTQFQVLARDLQMPSEVFVKSQLKRLYHEFDGKLSIEDIKRIDKEIDGMDFKGWLSTQKQALVGKGTSPGEQQKPKSTGTTAEVAAEAKSVGATNDLKT